MFWRKGKGLYSQNNMNVKFKKIFRILKKALLVLLGLVLIFLLGITIWNKVVCIQEDKALNRVGTNIRVSVTGEGNKTILYVDKFKRHYGKRKIYKKGT